MIVRIGSLLLATTVAASLVLSTLAWQRSNQADQILAEHNRKIQQQFDKAQAARFSTLDLRPALAQAARASVNTQIDQDFIRIIESVEQ